MFRSPPQRSVPYGLPRSVGLSIAALALISASAGAQISLRTAVDLALRNNPRVHMAEDDAARARAYLDETHDVYIPSLTGGAGLGQAYGYSPYPPTLFNFSAQSLVYSYAQFAYIRSAHLGTSAAHLELEDVREATAEDTTLTYVALDHDQQRLDVLNQELQYAERLVAVVQQRFDAGLERQVDLTTAKLTLAQMRLDLLRTEDERDTDRGHLGRLIGLPSASLRVEGGIPTVPLIDDPVAAPTIQDLAPGVASAFANARAREQTAIADSRFLYRPQVSLIVQYNRYASFTDSFKQLENLYKNFNVNIGANDQVYGVQISVPFLDRFRQAKARQSAADASHAFHDAQNIEMQALDGQSRLRHSITELHARTEVAGLEQQLAHQQLEVMLLQVTTAHGDGPQMTPKEEQNSRIAERQKYMALIDTQTLMLNAQINLLRQTGQLEAWIQSATRIQTPSKPDSGPAAGEVPGAQTGGDTDPATRH